jgi:hypothetical protein
VRAPTLSAIRPVLNCSYATSVREWSFGAAGAIAFSRLQLFQVSAILKDMRLLRVLIVALFGLLAVVAGLIMAAAISLATAFVLFVQRMLRQASPSRIPAGRPRQPSGASANAGDVIDVTATEVPVDSTPR